MDRRQKRRGNQQWRVSCVEDSYRDKTFCQLTVEKSAFLRSRESQGQQYKENDGKLHGDVTLVDDGESADTDTVRDFRFHSSTAAAATCCRFLQCAFVLKTQISSCKLTAGNDSFILYSYQNNIKQFATTKSVLPSYTDTYACSCKKKKWFQAQCKARS